VRCGEQLFFGSFGSIAKGWITVIRSSAPPEGCTPVPKMESKVAEKVGVVWHVVWADIVVYLLML
jgi:hypothetical protein